MATNSNSNNKIGVLLVGHGSRLKYGKDVISQLADIYRGDVDYPIEIGFMNMSKPSIPAAINKLANMGVKKIVVTPIFLAHGIHTTQDIPRILGLKNNNKSHHHNHNDDDHHHSLEKEESIQFEGEIIYTEPLGADVRIVDIIKDRVKDAL